MSRHIHAVRFYKDDETLCRIVAGFIADGLVAGSPALVVATANHRKGITDELLRLSIDVPALRLEDLLVLLDARETLERIMIDGKPSSARFRFQVSEAIDKLCRRRPDGVVRCYGEMVDLLWNDGMTDAAIRLEILWNHLANTQQFSLLCGYSMNHCYTDSSLTDILSQHTHGMSELGELQRIPLARPGA